MRDEIIKQYYKRLAEEALEEKEKNKDLINDFIRYAGSRNINISEEQIEYIYTIGLIVNHQNIFYTL